MDFVRVVQTIQAVMDVMIVFGKFLQKGRMKE